MAQKVAGFSWWMSAPAKVDAEWNAWYSGEYVPGYRKIPSVIYARRYRDLEGTSGYSTVYEFARRAVPESPEWNEQQQHSSPNLPRTRQAMTHAPGSPGVYVRVNPYNALSRVQHFNTGKSFGR